MNSLGRLFGIRVGLGISTWIVRSTATIVGLGSMFVLFKRSSAGFKIRNAKSIPKEYYLKHKTVKVAIKSISDDGMVYGRHLPTVRTPFSWTRSSILFRPFALSPTDESLEELNKRIAVDDIVLFQLLYPEQSISGLSAVAVLKAGHVDIIKEMTREGINTVKEEHVNRNDPFNLIDPVFCQKLLAQMKKAEKNALIKFESDSLMEYSAAIVSDNADRFWSYCKGASKRLISKQ